MMEDSRRDGKVLNFFDIESSQVCQLTIWSSGRLSQESSDLSFLENRRLIDGTSFGWATWLERNAQLRRWTAAMHDMHTREARNVLIRKDSFMGWIGKIRIEADWSTPRLHTINAIDTRLHLRATLANCNTSSCIVIWSSRFWFSEKNLLNQTAYRDWLSSQESLFSWRCFLNPHRIPDNWLAV
jgi:hypothetical protein